MALEVALGFTGYFAGFREPLIMAAIAMFEIFNRRDIRHWGFAAALGVVLAVSSLVWVSVRGQLRQENGRGSRDRVAHRAIRARRARFRRGCSHRTSRTI